MEEIMKKERKKSANNMVDGLNALHRVQQKGGEVVYRDDIEKLASSQTKTNSNKKDQYFQSGR